MQLREDLFQHGSLRRSALLAAKQTPVFGSAINNFGVKELLSVFVRKRRLQWGRTLTRDVQPIEPKFTFSVWAIQANLDKAYHDRMAFVRITSGEYKRGMNSSMYALTR